MYFLKHAIVFSLLSVLLLSMIGCSEAYSNGRVDVLIGFKGKPDESAIRVQGGVVKCNFHPFINVLAVNIPEKAVSALLKNPQILYVEADAEAYAIGDVSASTEYLNSWGVDRIEADKVHPYDKGTGISVFVVDTGIDYNHPELASNYKGGWDFVNNDTNPMDDNGHGTHVAGSLAAVLNGVGVVGAAPEAYLYAVKVLNQQGSGTYSNVIAGIKWSSDNNAKIISMSLGGTADSASLKSAVDAAYAKGALLIAAAGNNGNSAGTGDSVLYPARYDSVIAVAATKQDDTRASWSSTGPAVELSAPGVSIQSTWLAGTYKILSGTSMATPHVSGSAALVWLSDEKAWSSASYTNGDGIWTNVEVRTVLDMTAQDLGAAGRDSQYGYGLVRPDIASVPTSTPPTPINNPPVANAGIDQTVNEGTLVTLDGRASYDPDGDAVSYLWTQTSGPFVTLSGADTATPTFTAPDVGSEGATLTFPLTVTSTGSLSSTDTVNVIVNDAPSLTSPMSATLVTDKTTYVLGEFVKLTVTATSNGSPVSGASVHLGITTASGKAYVADSTTDASGHAVFTFKTKKPDGTGTYPAVATVSKAGFNTASDTATFIVNAK